MAGTFLGKITSEGPPWRYVEQALSGEEREGAPGVVSDLPGTGVALAVTNGKTPKVGDVVLLRQVEGAGVVIGA